MRKKSSTSSESKVERVSRKHKRIVSPTSSSSSDSSSNHQSRRRSRDVLHRRSNHRKSPHRRSHRSKSSSESRRPRRYERRRERSRSSRSSRYTRSRRSSSFRQHSKGTRYRSLSSASRYTPPLELAPSPLRKSTVTEQTTQLGPRTEASKNTANAISGSGSHTGVVAPSTDGTNDDAVVMQPPTTENASEQLDEEALLVLGDDPSKTKEVKNSLRSELLVRWSTWISEGLEKEVKAKLLEKYESLPNLRAQTLNPELASLLSEQANKRDAHFVNAQNLIGSTFTALGVATSALLTKDFNRKILLETLSDVGKLIKSKPDEFLFGKMHN